MFFVFVGFVVWMHLFILSPMLFRALATDQNAVNLSLVGQWNDDYGDFHAVKVWMREEIRQAGKIWVNYAACATSKGVVIFDIDRRSVVSFIPLGECDDLEIEKTNNEGTFYVYVAGGEAGLYIINLDNPQKPYYVAQCNTLGSARDVAIAGDYAYVTHEHSGLQVIDISNKSSPKIVGRCDTPDSAEDIIVVPSSQDDDLVVPLLQPGSANGIAVAGDYAYVVDEYRGIHIIDVSNKDRPRGVGSCETLDSARDVAVTGDYA